MKNHIRVVSTDGLKFQITDAQTGAVIPGVRGIKINAPHVFELATVELEIICAEVDVVGKLGAVEFVSVDGKRHRFEAVVEAAPASPDEPELGDVTEAGDAVVRRRQTSG